MPHKDAKIHLQNAAALVNQWHFAYMEVMPLPVGTRPQVHSQLGLSTEGSLKAHCKLRLVPYLIMCYARVDQ